MKKPATKPTRKPSYKRLWDAYMSMVTHNKQLMKDNRNLRRLAGGR